MRTRCIAILLGLFATFAGAGAAIAQFPAPRCDCPALASELDEIFREWNRADAPGAAVAVVRGDSVLAVRTYGMAELEHGIAVSNESRFDLASVSKQFTGYAIARLASTGQLDLDMDIRTFFPGLPEAGHVVTPRHMVHHVSGIRDWVELLWMSGWHFDDVISTSDILHFAEAQRDLNFQPGAEYTYSNTAFNLLAMIVGEVTGMSFGTWLKQEVFEPLGMERSVVQQDHHALVLSRTGSYEPSDGGFSRLTNNTMGVGSSSILSTPDDMARWLLFLNRMETEDPATGRLFRQRGVLNSGDTISYAFGINVDFDGGVPTMSHGGSWRGYRSHLLRFPDQEVGIFVVSNSTAFSSARMAREVADVVLPGLLPPPSVRTAASGAEEEEQVYLPTRQELQGFVGRYWSPELSSHWEVRMGEDGVLRFWHSRHGGTDLSPAAADVLTLAGIRGQQTLEFFRAADGTVAGFSLSGARFRGVEFTRAP